MSYVNKLGDYKPFKVMRIIKSVSKQYSWNNCSKSLLSSVATVFYANIAVDLALYLSGGLNKLNSPGRIIRDLWWQPSGENKTIQLNKRAWLWEKKNRRRYKTNKRYVKCSSQRLMFKFEKITSHFGFCWFLT